MPLPSVKKTPSDIDVKVWELNKLRGIPLREIAVMLDLHIDTVKYHSCEANRIIGTDLVKVKDDLNHLTIPIAISALKLIGKTFSTESPKYVDAAIKFLRNAGYTIEQSEMTITLKDSTPADTAFDSIFQQYKNRAQQADIIDPGSDTSSNSQATPTSTRDEGMSILPLDKSHIENPKSDNTEISGDVTETPDKIHRDEDY